MLNVTSDVYNLLNMKKLDSMAHWGTGILFHDSVSNKFLLGIRKDNGLWGSPGGKVENGILLYSIVTTGKVSYVPRITR